MQFNVDGKVRLKIFNLIPRHRLIIRRIEFISDVQPERSDVAAANVCPNTNSVILASVAVMAAMNRNVYAILKWCRVSSKDFMRTHDRIQDSIVHCDVATDDVDQQQSFVPVAMDAVTIVTKSIAVCAVSAIDSENVAIYSDSNTICLSGCPAPTS